MSTPALLNYEEELRLLLLKKRRKAIRASLTEFSRYCGYEPAPHHRLLIARLEAVARGALARLAVFMPPGSAKSTYGSVLFPPWFMAQSSGSNILASSHTTDLAEKWGRPIRNRIEEHGPALAVTTKQALLYSSIVQGAGSGAKRASKREHEPHHLPNPMFLTASMTVVSPCSKQYVLSLFSSLLTASGSMIVL